MTGSALRGGDEALARNVLAYLAAHHVMTVATAEPWAAAVFYVNDGYTLYFLSSPRSRHARFLEDDGRAAATIQEEYDDWREIRGVQLEGRVRQVASDMQADVRARYLAKFPALAGASAMAPIVEALARIEWYALVAERLYLIDNTIAFGHRECLDLR